MAFEYGLRARFFEVDRAGIVFFGRFFEYAHAAYEELLVAAVGPGEQMFREAPWGTPLVHAEADFAQPVFMGDALLVRSNIVARSRRTLTFEHQILAADDETSPM